MEKLTKINQFYKSCKDAINPKLLNLGYKISQKKNHLKCEVWINYKEKHCYRFIWHEQDQCFSLEESDYINDPEKVGWLDAVVVDYDGNISNRSIWGEIIEEIKTEII